MRWAEFTTVISVLADYNRISSLCRPSPGAGLVPLKARPGDLCGKRAVRADLGSNMAWARPDFRSIGGLVCWIAEPVSGAVHKPAGCRRKKIKKVQKDPLTARRGGDYIRLTTRAATPLATKELALVNPYREPRKRHSIGLKPNCLGPKTTRCCLVFDK